MPSNPQAIFLIIIGAVLMALVLRFANKQIVVFIRNLFIWVILLLVTVAAYTYRNEIMSSRLMSELMPMRPTILDNGALMFSRQADGAFHIEINVNNQAINCILDTGASRIVLDQSMANSAGIDATRLDYSIPMATANGTGFSAKTTVNNLSIGPLKLSNIDIYVNQAAMDSCLLGMSFLNRLHSFTIEHDTLTLNP